MVRDPRTAHRIDMTTAPLLWDPIATNRNFYNALWSRARLTMPDRFNTWSVLSELAATRPRRAELGPGLHPRLPLDQTIFIEGSPAAVNGLRAAGAQARCADLASIPLDTASMELVGAFDVIEHVPDDEALLAEVARVLTDGGILVLSAPLHPHRWTEFDDTVGHVRRYEARALVRMLARHGLEVTHSAGFGMKPANSWLTRLAVWQLKRHFDHAMDWYNRWLFPLALHRQKTLKLERGFEAASAFDDVVLQCVRTPRIASPNS